MATAAPMRGLPKLLTGYIHAVLAPPSTPCNVLLRCHCRCVLFVENVVREESCCFCSGGAISQLYLPAFRADNSSQVWPGPFLCVVNFKLATEAIWQHAEVHIMEAPFLCVNVFVCVYVCVYVCVHVWVRACVHMQAYSFFHSSRSGLPPWSKRSAPEQKTELVDTTRAPDSPWLTSQYSD